LPPMEAIVANTSLSAWLMGLEGEVGVIAPGKLADIVIRNSDPIADITVQADCLGRIDERPRFRQAGAGSGR